MTLAPTPERGPATRLARWRASVAMRLMLWTVAAGVAFVNVAAQFDEPGDLGTVAIGLWLLAVTGLFVFMSTGYIDLFDDAVVIDGRLRRHREVPLVEIVSVEPGRWGLHFRTGPYSGVSGPGCIGAKGWGSELLRLHVCGDRIADAVMSAANEARAHSGRADAK